MNQNDITVEERKDNYRETTILEEEEKHN